MAKVVPIVLLAIVACSAILGDLAASLAVRQCLTHVMSALSCEPHSSAEMHFSNLHHDRRFEP